jgi:hypothetical protein
MDSQRVFHKSLGKLMHAVVAAGLVVGMTGFASAQSCTDTKDCFTKKGLQRTEVMNLSTKLRECLRNNQKVPAYDRSAVPNDYLNQIKEQDAWEKLQQTEAQKAEKKKPGSSMAILKEAYSKSLAVYTAAAADAQQKMQYYNCGGAAAKPAAAQPPAAKPAAAQPPAAKPAAAQPPAAKPAAAAAPAAQKLIKVLSAKYGFNCKAAKPDVTAHIASACNGKPSCSYQVNHTILGDTAPNCAKAYNVDYECAPGQARGAGAPAEASGKTVQLACN